ncbi:hypothetical protein GK082_12040 [Escherichia coli]|nr:hypothetical protein [Escherichia coli]
MKGLENAIRNLNSLDTRMVPQASAWAINRVAQKAVSVATRQVAGNTVAGDNQVKGIPLKLVRQRVRVFKASIRENDDGTYAITAVQHVPEKNGQQVFPPHEHLCQWHHHGKNQ